MDKPNASKRELSKRWVSLGKACEILGVNESTLRHWADTGAVRAFRTPGGHRRFAEEDVYSLMTQSEGGGGGKSLEDLKDVALTHIRKRLNRSKSIPGQWHRILPEAEKIRLRPLGRRLLALASDYLTKERGKGQLLEEARSVGEEYGIEAARHGLSLHDALEAFLFFRNSLDSIAKDLTQGQDFTADQAMERWQQINTFLDQVLLATVGAYELAVSLERKTSSSRRGNATRQSKTVR